MQLGNEMPRATVIATLRLVDPLKGENAETDKEIHAFCDELGKT